MGIDWTKLGLAVSMLVSISSLVGVIIALRKTPHEIKQTDATTGSIDAQTDAMTAETSGKYIEMANKAAERALKLDERIKILEDENAEQSKKMRFMQGEINKLVELNDELSRSNKKLEVRQEAVYDWALQLSDQVVELNGIPIKPKFELPV
jgi:hypothetical protein